jgi:hypothetical protein
MAHGTPTGSAQTCLGDATLDQEVNSDDLMLVLSTWGSNYPAADFDQNGVVNVTDLSDVLSGFGNCL